MTGKPCDGSGCPNGQSQEIGLYHALGDMRDRMEELEQATSNVGETLMRLLAELERLLVRVDALEQRVSCL